MARSESPTRRDDTEAAALTSAPESSSQRTANTSGSSTGHGRGGRAKWRHTLGITLLLVTVVLWTASNFLASTIFADNTYSKPYFVTYVNSAFFIIPLIPILAAKERRHPGQFREIYTGLRSGVWQYRPVKSEDEEDPFLKPSDDDEDEQIGSSSTTQPLSTSDPVIESSEKLSVSATARLSLQFCMIWFFANYFTAACLEYTTVASSTILTSTSSIWTLVIGSFFGVEKFSVKKLLGVLASLAGIVLISSVDVSGQTDDNRGTFPHKSSREIAIGDTLAFVSAVMYGLYAVIMKRKIGDESTVNMPLFFGLVGLFITLMLWPFFFILHFTGVERFELPPAGRVLTIVLVNSTTSLVSDFCWAYAMLLTSPLIVTVGLSLTIPLSLVGQMVINSQSSGLAYWLGAFVVFLSFIFINHEESKDEQPNHEATGEALLHGEGGPAEA